MKKWFLILSLMAILFSACTPNEENVDMACGNLTDLQLYNDLRISRESNQLTSEDALKVAALFRNNSSENKRIASRASKSTPKITVYSDDETSQPLLYVAEWNETNEFVIISASKNCPPILAYSKGEPKVKEPLDNEKPDSYFTLYKEIVKSSTEVESDSLRMKFALEWAIFEKSAFPTINTRAINPNRPAPNISDEIARRDAQGYVYFGTLRDLHNYIDAYNCQMTITDIGQHSDSNYDYLDYSLLFAKFQYTGTVTPLLQTHWHQHNPFNVDAPNGIAGCGPIAVAQAVYYHQFPNFYNWSQIGVNPVINESFRYFINDIRDRCNVTYNPNSTSTTLAGINQALTGLLYNVTFYDYAALPNMNSELNALRPIIMTGLKNSGVGHAWVCDGKETGTVTEISISYVGDEHVLPATPNTSYCEYNVNYLINHPNVTDNFYHMNFGWGGSYDGWYRYNLYNPNTNVIYPNYTNNQAIFLISPNYNAI